MNFTQTKTLYEDHILPTYGRQEVCFVRGEGSYLYDDAGKRYLDFASGWGVMSVGHAHPQWVKAVAEQAAALVHTSNYYYTRPGGLLAERLCELSGLDALFFANSGAEANEGLIKAARKYSGDKYGQNRHTVVTLNRSFHGRTHTMLAATGQDAYHKYFQPLTPGFVHADMGDLDALKALGDDVCAVLFEPVQGEGGVYPLEEAYVKAVAALCAERDWLLLFDEVQTGAGRCGTWFGFQHYGVEPDGISFAKGVGGGFPIGGFILGKKARGVFAPGLHGSTFGGTPLACAAALATLDILTGVLGDVERKGRLLRDGIGSFGGRVRGTRGRGLMIGVVVEGDPKAYAKALLDHGLLCLTAGTDAVRLLPPLTVSDSEIGEGLSVLREVLA
ncbi:MAG: acetylornithine/succinylornithine family transaminase [Oscillospiraceae bacterium]|jgi:acetylornithine/N-succinyldiaminopimelate aminotransferase|nr:acetylornithine/succinylornithine family transaminase [Oscillospiraceae bacterium]